MRAKDGFEVSRLKYLIYTCIRVEYENTRPTRSAPENTHLAPLYMTSKMSANS